jgi:hypothetical protein
LDGLSTPLLFINAILILVVYFFTPNIALRHLADEHPVFAANLTLSINSVASTALQHDFYAIQYLPRLVI